VPAAESGPDERSSARSRLAVVWHVAAILLTIAAAVSVWLQLASGWDTSRESLTAADGPLLALALISATAGVTWIAVTWRQALGLLGGSVTRGESVAWYYLGELGKYVPGGVWSVIGRSELARRGGVPRPAAYASVGLSLAGLYLACATGAVALLPFALARGGTPGLALAVLIVPPIGVALLHPRIVTPVLEWGERRLRRTLGMQAPAWRDSVGLVARYGAAWVFIGTATWLVARALDPAARWYDVCFATLLSWLVGFLVAPAPGGLGIREATFVGVVTLPSSTAAAVAVIARLLFVVIDATGALAAAATPQVRRLGRRRDRVAE
jgi:glycosyltransferase 2 family protein